MSLFDDLQQNRTEVNRLQDALTEQQQAIIVWRMFEQSLADVTDIPGSNIDITKQVEQFELIPGLDTLLNRGIDSRHLRVGAETLEATQFGQVYIQWVVKEATSDELVRALRLSLAEEFKQLAGQVRQINEALQSASVQLRESLAQAQQQHIDLLNRADTENTDPLALLNWEHPVALLPVRLETRFDLDAGVLRVRVYPDQIHVDSHQRTLDSDEIRRGKAFWLRLYMAVLMAKHPPGDVQSIMPPDFADLFAGWLDDYEAKTTGTPAERFRQIRERLWAYMVERSGETRATYIVHHLLKPGIRRSVFAGFEDNQPLLVDLKPLSFNPVVQHEDTWTQPVYARLLPDRWRAYGYYSASGSNNEQVIQATSSAILKPLAVLVQQPQTGQPDQADWLTDYKAAKQVGMAFEIPLPGDWNGRFDRITVMGVATTLTPQQGADALADVLHAQRYSEGLEVMQPGTPTNNADVPSGMSTRRAASESLQSAIGTSPDSINDGTHLGQALGIGADAMTCVDGAASQREQHTRAMNDIIWNAVPGYFARNFLGRSGSHLPLGTIEHSDGIPAILHWLETYYHHFVDYVRGGGALPVLRVKSQPYGILPVSPVYNLSPMTAASNAPASSLNTHVPPISDDEFMPDLIHRLDSAGRVWLEAAQGMPSLADGQADKQELLAMLSQEPVAGIYRRNMWWMMDTHPILDYFNIDPPEDTRSSINIQNALNALGMPENHIPRLMELVNLGFAPTADDLPFSDEMADYVSLLLLVIQNTDDRARLLRLISDLPDVRRTLLRQLMWFGMIQAMVASRARVGAAGNDPLVYPPDPDIYPIVLQPARAKQRGYRTIYDTFNDIHPLNAQGQEATYLDLMQATQAATETGNPLSTSSHDPVFGRFVQSLATFTDMDVSESSMLMREALDTTSHRLDAWWTSLATRQLARVRDEHPHGIYIGAYGFVENLEPASKTGQPEYLLAPSLDQATTAAILRSVHKSHTGTPQADVLEVNLSAEQVRRAMPIMQGVRNGQTVGELLGQTLERALYRAGLQPLINQWRTLAPAITGKVTELKAGAPPQATQSDVVDGLKLYQIWQQNPNFIPDNGSPDEVRAMFESTGRTLDAINDILLAEGVHHLAHGRPERAAAALEALSSGAVPPQTLDVLQTPRQMTGTTQQLMVLFGGQDAPQPVSEWQPAARISLQPDDMPPRLTLPQPVIPELERLELDLSVIPIIDSELPTLPGGELIENLQPLPELTLNPDASVHTVRPLAEPYLNLYASKMLPAPQRVGCMAEFQWRAMYTTRSGTFDLPTVAGAVVIDSLDICPDAIRFSVMYRPADDPQHVIWSEGVYLAASDTQTAQSLAADASGLQSTQANDAVLMIYDSASAEGWHALQVLRTDDDGFTVRYAAPQDAITGITVRYQAFQLPDPAAWHIGQIDLQSTDTSVTLSLPDDLILDSALLFGVDNNQTAINGVVVSDTQVINALTLQPDTAETTIRHADGNLSLMDTSGGWQLQRSAAGTSMRLTYIAIEAPDGITPAVGEMTVDTTTTDSVLLDFGGQAEHLVLHATVAGTTDTGTAYSCGIASSIAEQHTVASGADGVTDYANRIVTLQTTGSDGTIQQTDLRLTGFTGEGARLRIISKAHDTIRLRFYALPALPDGVAYHVPMPLTLEKLQLSPLDALSLTQQDQSAGDGQLERRFAYYAFRHRPQSRPSVPDTADLELRFMDAPVQVKGVDVSVAEFIEAAGTLRTLVQTARPVDGRDFTTPSSTNTHGYDAAGSAARLAARAQTIEERLNTLLGLISNRLFFFAQNEEGLPRRLTHYIDDLSDAVQNFRGAYSFNTLIQALTQIEQSAGNVRDELRGLTRHLRAGSLELHPEDTVRVTAERQAKLTIETSLKPGTVATLTLLPLSDALNLAVQSDKAQTNRKSQLVADFDFRKYAPGTRFMVHVQPQARTSDDSEHEEQLATAIQKTSVKEQQQLLGEMLEYRLLNNVNLRMIVRYPRMDEQDRLKLWKQQSLAVQQMLLFGTGILEPQNEFEIAFFKLLREHQADLADFAGEFIKQKLLDSSYGLLVKSFEKLDSTLQLAFWMVQPAEVQRQLARKLDTELPALPRPGTSVAPGAFVITGRTMPQTDSTRELSDYMTANAPILQALFVVHGWLNQIETHLSIWTALRRAIQAVNTERYHAEVSLIQSVAALSDTLLTSDDLDALTTIDELLQLNLSALRQQLTEFTRLLSVSGLAEIMHMRGSLLYPDEIRYWRQSTPEIDGFYLKDAEGRVNARLQRIIESDGIPLTDPRLLEYSTLFRNFLANSGSEEDIAVLEWVLAHPVTVTQLLRDSLPDAHEHLHALHVVMHHTGKQLATPAQIAGQIRQLGEALTRQVILERLARIENTVAAHLSEAQTFFAELATRIERFGSSAPETDPFTPDATSALSQVESIHAILQDTSSLAGAFRAGVLEGVRHLLLRASCFHVYGSVPVNPAGRTPADERALMRQMQIVYRKLLEKATRAADLRGTVSADDVPGQIERLQAIFGDEMVVLPPFIPENYEAVQQTFAASDTLLSGNRHAAAVWLQRSVPVRSDVAAYQRMRTQARAFAVARGGRVDPVHRQLHVGQLNATQSQWVGCDGVVPQGGELLYVVSFGTQNSQTSPLPAQPRPIVGLYIDGRVERTPAMEETTGLTVHYDEPDARAPQAILLAVPPAWVQLDDPLQPDSDRGKWRYKTGQHWTLPMLKRTLDELVTLMAIRSVDRTALQDIDVAPPTMLMPIYRDTRNRQRFDPAPSIQLNEFDWWS